MLFSAPLLFHFAFLQWPEVEQEMTSVFINMGFEERFFSLAL